MITFFTALNGAVYYFFFWNYTCMLTLLPFYVTSCINDCCIFWSSFGWCTPHMLVEMCKKAEEGRKINKFDTKFGKRNSFFNLHKNTGDVFVYKAGAVVIFSQLKSCFLKSAIFVWRLLLGNFLGLYLFFIKT